MTSYYNRSEILSYFDLTTEQQNEYADREDKKEMSFVKCGDDILDLSNFTRFDKKCIWDGHYGMTYFSSYFIKFNRSGDEALIAYRYF